LLPLSSQIGDGGFLKEIVLPAEPLRVVLVAGYAAMVIGSGWFLVMRVPSEDATRKRHFGAKWERWAVKTKYSLLPFMY